MENLERGYFNTDHSIGKGKYEDLYTMDPALFNTAASSSQDPNSHQDLDNILGGSFMDQLGSGSGLMSAGFNPWDGQGTSYSPYPDMSYTHALPNDEQGAGLGGGPIPNEYGQSFSEHHDAGMQAVPYSQNQSTVQMDGSKAPTVTKSVENTIVADVAAKRKSEAAASAIDGAQPKPKKKRGPRKTKQKTEEEKRAKEERKLERNRMAASKCRQKKKVATEQMMDDFNELERQNHWMKACLEEAKQDRNNILALLLEHKSCGHAAVDKCLESQLARIAGEFEDPQPADTTMFGMDDDTLQFVNSNASSPSNESQNTSRRNSIAMSRSGSNASHQKSSTVSDLPQSWPTAGYQNWQEQFSMAQGYQQQPMSEPSKASRHHSPSSSSAAETSMSRQNSSRTSVSEEHDHQRNSNDSGISEIDTPPEERNKTMSDSPVDEAISLAAQDRVLRSRGPHIMMANQRISSMHPRMHGPADLQDRSKFLAQTGL
jgi:hypothetical protein